MAFVTSPEKESGSRHLFFSTIFPEQLQIFCSYMVRSRKGIEMLVNLINISYCAMKLLPYSDELFYGYRSVSVQEFRFALSEQIRRQVFYAIFVKNIETGIKSTSIMNALKQLIQQQGYHL